MSTSNTQGCVAKKRAYRLGKRAEKQAETRRRIVEAAFDLHSTLGPAKTTVSQIAERAGVQRHTYYAHFPDELDLFLACSALALERDPLPDLRALRRVAAGHDRVRRGLGEIYRWYERNERQTACVLRDADDHELTRQVVDLRMGPFFSAVAELMGEALGERSRSLLAVALDFSCWRTLRQSQSTAAAATLMADAIAGVGE